MKKLLILTFILLFSISCSYYRVSHCRTYKIKYNKLNKQLKEIQLKQRSGKIIKGSELLMDELKIVSQQQEAKMALRKYQDCIDRE